MYKINIQQITQYNEQMETDNKVITCSVLPKEIKEEKNNFAHGA